VTLKLSEISKFLTASAKELSVLVSDIGNIFSSNHLWESFIQKF